MDVIPEDSGEKDRKHEEPEKEPENASPTDHHGVQGEQESEQPKAERLLVQRARKLLNRRMRVGVTDGRTFFGKFHCLDKQGNIILSDTVEQMEGSSSSADAELRHLGLVLIPAIHQTSCHVECALHEQMSLLSIDN